MTHDLFKSFAHGYDFKVKEIIISDLKEGVFFAKIICEGSNGTVEVDARPSDAIAIGLRFEAEIYTYETILSEAGIVLSDEMEEDVTEIKGEVTSKTTEPDSMKSQTKDYSIDKLNEMLKEAIENEDYEKAANIRDELSRRN